MREAQSTGSLDEAAEKGGFEETLAAFESGRRGRRRRVPATRKGECAGLRGSRASRPPSRARRRRPSHQGGWGAAFVAAVAAEVEALIGPERVDAQDFEALEQAVRRQALGIAASLMARRLNADHSDHSGSTTACGCGQTARYAGRRCKTFTSVLGPLTLERAYYHCDACRAGICPRDRALGLQQTSLSPGVLRMVGQAGSAFSFAAASELVGKLAGVWVKTKQVERNTEGLGRTVDDDERDVAEPVPAPAPTMHLGLDGTGVPVRPAEVEGRRGKQADGSAKTREVKLVTVWTAEARDKQGRPQRDPGSVSYNAAVESAASRDTDPQPAAFAQRVHREAQRRGFDTAARQVVIGDGAAWIWNLAAEQFPRAI